METGITDGVHTEIKSGMDEGATVVLDLIVGRPEGEMMPEGGDEENSPFMPGPPNRNKNKNSGSDKK